MSSSRHIHSAAAAALFFTALVGVGGLPAPVSAHTRPDDAEICHSHGAHDVPHCHFEWGVDESEVTPESPLREVGVRSAVLLRKVLGIEYEPLLAEADAKADAVCRRDADCPKGRRCDDGVCRLPRFRPAKLLLDGLSMSFRIGGPGAVMQVRW